jgi:hypothetical protein
VIAPFPSAMTRSCRSNPRGLRPIENGLRRRLFGVVLAYQCWRPSKRRRGVESNARGEEGYQIGGPGSYLRLGCSARACAVQLKFIKQKHI